MKSLILLFMIISIHGNLSAQVRLQFPDEISLAMHSIFESNGILGGSVIAFDTKGYHSFAYGHAFPDSITFTDTTFLRIASISKMFTGMTILQLVHEGKVNLDDDINTYLKIPLINPSYPKIPITIRMLLNHTSTLKDTREILTIARKTMYRDSLYPNKQIPDFTDLLKKGKNLFLPKSLEIKKGIISKVIPGKYFHYTNLNFVIIAHIIETIEKDRFHLIVKNRLLDRYSIPGGFIVQDLPEHAILSPQYLPKGRTWIPEADFFEAPYDSIFTSLEEYVPGRNVLRFSPQAGLRISTLGLSTFFRSFLADTGMKEIRSMMITSSWKSGIDNNSQQFDNLFTDWGLACHIIRDKQEPFTKDFPWIGHIGRANGAYTIMYMSPSTQKGIIIFVNGKKQKSKGSTGFEEFEKDIMNLILHQFWRKE